MSVCCKKQKSPASEQHIIYIGNSHVVEVKKGGLRIGIYVITKTQRRRGVILPYDTWISLINSIDVINLGLDFARELPLNSTGWSTNQQQQQYASVQGGYNYGVTATETGQFTPALHIEANGRADTVATWPYTEPAKQYFNTGELYQKQPYEWGEEGYLSSIGSTGLWYPGKKVSSNNNNNTNNGTIYNNNNTGSGWDSSIVWGNQQQQETCPVFTPWYMPTTQSFQAACGQA